MNRTWQDNYEQWINHAMVSPRLREEAMALTEHERALAFTPQPFRFGTAGCRLKMGTGPNYLNEITYQQLAYGYGRYIQSTGNSGGVVVVHDNRRNGAKFARVVANVLTSLGIDVYMMPDNAILSTPIISYLIIRMRAAGGVNITASHNPKEYNGFKCYNHFGSQLLPDGDKAILSQIPDWPEILAMELAGDPDHLHTIDTHLIDDYFKDLARAFAPLPGGEKIRFLFTPMHGTSAEYMPRFLNSLGYECIPFAPQMEIDPDFRHADVINPEEPAAFDKILAAADAEGIPLVLACDPDADRLGVAFKHGGEWIYLNGNIAGILETFYLLSHHTPDGRLPVVVSTFVTNGYIDRIATKYGARVVRVPTGFKWIADIANHLDPEKEDFIIGFEEAIGSLPSNINREKDSYQVAAILLKILQTYPGKDFYDILVEELYPQFGQWFGRTIFKIIPGDDWYQKAKEYMKQVVNYPNPTLGDRTITSISENKFGGTVDFNFDDGSWVKFRISGTEPKFKMYFSLYNDRVGDPIHAIDEEITALGEEIARYLNLNA